MDEAPDDASLDAWLGGRLMLAQPRRGHRVGTDAAMLAAAFDLADGRVVDLGAGVGAVGLAIVSRNERATCDLVEVDPAMAALAKDNASRNELCERARIVAADVFDRVALRAAGLGAESADAIVTNPPFFEAAGVRAPSDAATARAWVFGGGAGEAPLVAWIRAGLALLKAHGRFAMIHRPEALPAILAGAEGRLGGLAIIPLYPRAGGAAHRLLVSGVKGSRAPLRIAPGLVLHEADGRLTAEAEAIHRGERLVDWGVS
jgi:tRNA1(Val) A37 N6-methylase TrmN6